MTNPPPTVLKRSEHIISRKGIDPNALRVLYRLHRAGCKAYVVGGGVRDLMLGRTPKDFDISTDARPERVRRLFRNSRIIGRRFRLVHVYFHNGFVVEASTFRRAPDPEAQAARPGELLITNDNVYGTPREDAFRRDFTVNALFYDISTFEVIDYVGGIEDLERRSIRTIGDPDVRFREDPVRMMRACELAGRLDFTIDPASQEAMLRQKTEIAKASPARLAEEIVELLLCGSSAGALGWMQELELIDELLPELRAARQLSADGLGSFENIPWAIDQARLAGAKLSDVIVLSGLMLPKVLAVRLRREAKSRRPLTRRQLETVVIEALESFVTRFRLSRARSEGMAMTILTFFDLGRSRWHSGEQARFVQRRWFPEAVRLLEVVVAATGEEPELLADWQAALALRKQGPPRATRPRRRAGRRRRRRR